MRFHINRSYIYVNNYSFYVTVYLRSKSFNIQSSSVRSVLGKGSETEYSSFHLLFFLTLIKS